MPLGINFSSPVNQPAELHLCPTHLPIRDLQHHLLMHQLPGKPILPHQHAVRHMPCQFDLATRNRVAQRLHVREQHLRGEQSVGPQRPAVQRVSAWVLLQWGNVVSVPCQLLLRGQQHQPGGVPSALHFPHVLKRLISMLVPKWILHEQRCVRGVWIRNLHKQPRSRRFVHIMHILQQHLCARRLKRKSVPLHSRARGKHYKRHDCIRLCSSGQSGILLQFQQQLQFPDGFVFCESTPYCIVAQSSHIQQQLLAIRRIVPMGKRTDELQHWIDQ